MCKIIEYQKLKENERAQYKIAKKMPQQLM
jgi:hypothetical protein